MNGVGFLLSATPLVALALVGLRLGASTPRLERPIPKERRRGR